MTNFNFPGLEAFAKASSLGAAGLFSSLNTAFGGGSAGASLFDSLLADVHVDMPSANVNMNAANNPPVTPTNDAANAAANASGPFAALQDVASAWNGFIQKWQTYQDEKRPAAQNNGPSAGAPANKVKQASSSPPSADNTTPAQTQTPPVTTASTAPQTPPASNPITYGTTTTVTGQSTQDSTSTGNPPSLGDLLAELQAIMHMMHQQMRQSPSSAGAPNGGNVPATAVDPTNAANNSDPASGNINTAPGTPAPASSQGTDNGKGLFPIADMIAELLMLSRFAEKKLGLDPSAQTQDANSSSATSSTASSTPSAPVDADLASLDAQLRTDLKSLLDALQANVATAAANDNTSATTTNATVTNANVQTNNSTATNNNTNNLANNLATNDLASNLPPAIATTAPTPAADPSQPLTPPQLVQTALNLADTFVKQLDALFGPPAPIVANAAFVPALAATTPSSGGDNGSSLNSGPADSQDDISGGVTSDASSNTPQISGGDSTKGSDPYSFASQLSALRAANGGTTGLPDAVEQVMFQLSRNVKNGNDQMSIQLQPADLGRIDIKLNFGADGTVQGTVVANNPATLDLLLKDVRGLERALQEAGLSADPGSLQFSLGGQPGDTSKQTAGNSSSGQPGNSGDQETAGDSMLPLADANSTDPSETWYVTPGRVNLQV